MINRIPAILLIVALVPAAFYCSKKENYFLPGVEYRPGPKGRALGCPLEGALRPAGMNRADCGRFCSCVEFGSTLMLDGSASARELEDEGAESFLKKRGCSRLEECPRRRLAFVCRSSRQVVYYYNGVEEGRARTDCARQPPTVVRIRELPLFDGKDHRELPPEFLVVGASTPLMVTDEKESGRQRYGAPGGFPSI